MTAAVYAARAGKKTLVFEAKSVGGQILNASEVENYPAVDSISGFDFSNNLYNQAVKFGAEVRFETVIHVEGGEPKTVTTDSAEYTAKAVILATGSRNRKLGVENEDKFVGSGVSYCATCDGNFFRKRDVAVVGGGNTAIEDTLYLSNICAKVYLIHRRSEFRGEEKLQRDLDKRENIELVLNSKVTRINGNFKVDSIDVASNDGTERTIEVSGLFIAVGQEPNNQMFRNVVELSDYGYIVSEDGFHTATPGIYVAGDTREKELRQLATAVGDGANAAAAAIREMED